MSSVHTHGDWRGRRCLVTGASGFIGTALCKALTDRGADVHSTGRTRPAAVRGAWHDCDVTDLPRLRHVFSAVEPTVVFHLASMVTGSRDIELVVPTLHHNLIGTVNVLLSSVATALPRVVCMGSLQEPDDRVLGVPASPYSASKLAASAYARMFATLYSLPVVVARTFMVYGPGQLDYTKVLPYVLSHLLEGKHAELSSGKQEFDWVYVDDVIEALLAIAMAEKSSGATVDVGSGVLTSVRDVVLGAAQRLGAADSLRFGVVPDRRFEPTRHADVERTADLVGWRPSVALEAGLDATIRWYRNHLGSRR